MTLQATIAAALDMWREEAVAQVGPVAFRAYAATHRDEIVATIEKWARKKTAPRSAGDRVAANLAILELLREKSDDQLTRDDLAILDRYTGWGGLPSERAEQAGWSLETIAGTDEYYTPIEVADAIGAALAPCLATLAGRTGTIKALEPAAGTGRLIRGIEGAAVNVSIEWTAIELSPIAGRILPLLHPSATVYRQGFEQWVSEHGAAVQGKLRLIVSNPPFSDRGLAHAEHPDYKEGPAYAYFMRRSLDLLAPGGLGVIVTPRSFLDAERSRELRSRVLARHHLVAAFRLPARTFAGASAISDVVILRARGGELTELDNDDAYIAAGNYFTETPDHVLESVDFPAIVERGGCFSCCAATRQTSSTDRSTPSTDPLEIASSLGYRILHLRGLLNDGDPTAYGRWSELRRDLDDFRSSEFVERHDGSSNPWVWPKLVAQAVDDEGIDSYLNAFTRDGDFETWLESMAKPYHRYRGDPHNVADQAAWLFRLLGVVELETLVSLHSDVGGHMGADDIRDTLTGAGWNVALHESETRLEPDRVYYTGDLWPKYDAVREHEEYAGQVERLRRAIASVPIEDVDLSPRSSSWIPISQLTKWVGRLTGDSVQLERRGGLIQLEEVPYSESGEQPITDELRCLLAWLNFDKRGFKPRKSPAIDVDEVELDRLREVDQHRMRWATRWLSSWRSFATAWPGRRASLGKAYNRAFRGLVRREYEGHPLTIPRWATSMRVRLRPHQIHAARRAIDERQGLIALDTGLGKTYTGIAVLATGRAQGWARRPVIVCPNSLVWKWFDDLAKVLRDYRVAVIGSHRHRRHHGADVDALREQLERGDIDEQEFASAMITSRLDTPRERLEKWQAFEAGGFDAVIMTPQAMAKTTVSDELAERYGHEIEALARMKSLDRPVTVDNGKADGLVWDFVDFLLVDEGADYKNLFTAPTYFGAVPKYAGGSAVSARAWQMHLRAFATRQQNEHGRGVVLMTATPLKNSPIELYNLLHIVNPAIWERAGINCAEQFAERFLRIAAMDAIPDCDMNIAAGPAVVGFRNVDELRGIVGQVVEIKTADDTDLKLPVARKHVVEVDMNPQQRAKYKQELAELGDAGGSASTISTQMRLALVAVHHALDEGYTWETAESGIDGAKPDPQSPKFAAIAERIVASPDCGHIVFMEPKAGHRWLQRVLVDSGIPADRIAVMNSDACRPAERLEIAAAFNGVDGKPHRYDVLIVNSVAYEGMDLQARTCAVHHADLPWTPADLEQRNGRALRQGNRCSTLEIYYYVARGSTDRYRLGIIDGKSNWLRDLLAGKSDIHNPAGAIFSDPGELLIQLANRPEEAKEVLEGVKQRRKGSGERLGVDDTQARNLVRKIAARFRMARESSDPHLAIRMRHEGENLMSELRAFEAKGWVWAKWLEPIHHLMPLIPRSGPPVFEGLRITRLRKRSVDAFEFGRVRNEEYEVIGVRKAGGYKWERLDTAAVANLDIRVEDMPGISETPWPNTDGKQVIASILKRAHVLRSIPWSDWGWSVASQDFLAWAWPKIGHVITKQVRYFGRELPTIEGRKIVLASGRDVKVLIPPTLAGWHRFLRLANRSDLSRDEIEGVAQYWWGRRPPVEEVE